MRACLGRLAVPTLLVVTSACGASASGPPSAPFLDPVPAQTSRLEITLAGIAQPGTTVAVRREPEFASAEDGTSAGPAAVVADPVGGHFRFVVPLAAGVANVLDVTASNGPAPEDASPATRVTVLQVPPRPERLRLTPFDTQIDADAGKLCYRLEGTHADEAIALTGQAVTVTVEGYPVQLAPATATLDASGSAEGCLEGLVKVGEGTLVAAAAIADRDGMPAKASSPFVVHAGRPASVSVTLRVRPVDADPAGEPSAEVTLAAGDGAELTLVVTDAAGNVLRDAPLELGTNAPGARLVGTHLGGLERVGRWRVYATVRGGLVSGEAALAVTPAAGTGIALRLEPADGALVAGGTVTAFAQVEDRFGNVTGEAVTLSEDAPERGSGDTLDPQDFTDVVTEGGVTRGTLTLSSAGRFRVSAARDTTLRAEAEVRVFAGAPAELRLTAPEQVAAGVPLAYGYGVSDAFGNATADGVRVDVDAPGATLSDNAFDGGEVRGLRRAGAYRLEALVPGTDLVARHPFVVEPAAAARIALVTSAALVRAGEAVDASARVLDAYDNTTGGAVTLSEDVPVYAPGTPDEDAQAFEGVVVDEGATHGSLVPKRAGAYTVTATADGVEPATAALVVTAAAARTLRFDVPESVRAGEPLVYEHGVTDAFGNPTGDAVVVTIDSATALVRDDGVGGGDVRGLTRVAHRTLDAFVPGTTLTATRSFEVTPAADARVVLWTSAAALAAGTRVDARAWVEDAFGNTTGTVAALAEDAPVRDAGTEDEDPQDFVDVETQGGVTQGGLVVRSAGSFTLAASAGELTPATAALLVSPAAAAALRFEVPATVTAGERLVYAHGVTDAFGNATGDAVVVSVDPADAVVRDNGLDGGEVRQLTRAGAYVLDALVVGTALTATSPFEVTPAAGARVELRTSATAVRAGASVEASAWIEDVYGNVTGDAPTLAEDLPVRDAGTEDEDPQDFGSLGVADGVTTAVLVARSAGHFTVSASAEGLAAAEAALVVSAGAPAELAFDVPATLVAGETLTYGHGVTDTFGNPTGDDVRVVLESSDADVLDNGLDGGEVHGLERAGTYTLRALVLGTALLARRSLDVLPAADAAIALVLDASEVAAGTAVHASATVRDRFGNATGTPTTLSEDAPVFAEGTELEDAQDFTDVVSEGAVTRGTLTIKGAGSYTATASAEGLDDVAAALVVVPGTPSVFTFTLDASGAPYEAGEVVPYDFSVTDAFGNDAHTPVVVTVNAPNVVTGDDDAGHGEIVGLVRAATYNVRARVVGTLLVDNEPLVVGPAPGEGFNLTLSSAVVVEGSRVLLLLADAFGNALDLATVGVEVNGVEVSPAQEHPTATLDGNELTFAALGTYSVHAYLLAEPDSADTELVGVQSVIDTLPPEATIVRVLHPTSTNVALRSRIETSISLSDDRALAEAELVAQFGESRSCSATSGLLVLAGAESVTTTVSVQVPDCATPLDPVLLVVRATDQAGNVAFSESDTTLRVTPLPGFAVVAGDGYALSTFGYGDRLTTGATPADVVVDPSSNIAYVSLQSTDRAIVLFPNHTQDDVVDANGTRVNFNDARGLALAPDGTLYVSSPADMTLSRLSPDLVESDSFITPGGGAPERISYDDGPIPLLCVAQPDPDAVRCYRNASGAPVRVVNESGVGNGINTPEAVDVEDGFLWFVQRNGQVRRFTLQYDTDLNTVTTVEATPTLIFDITTSCPDPIGASPGCYDLVALPGGDVAVADVTAGRVWRVTPAGELTTIAEGFSALRGIDYAAGRLFVLDADLATVFTIEGSY